MTTPTVTMLLYLAPDADRAAVALDKLLPLALAETPAANPRAVARVAGKSRNFPLRFPRLWPDSLDRREADDAAQPD